MPQEPLDRQESVWTRASRNLIELLVPGALVIVGLLLTGPSSQWLIAALTVAITVSASTLIALMLSRYYMLRTETLIRELEVAFSKQLANMGAAAMARAKGEGMTPEELSEYEGRIEVETIWIVGEDFDTEVEPEAPFLKVVKTNIHKRRIKYVYIAPESPKLSHMFDRLRDELDIERDDPRLKVEFLDPDQWQRMPYTAGNSTIYDPAKKGVLPYGYFWDPGGDGNSFRELRQGVAKMVGEIQEVCPKLDPNHHGARPEPPRAGTEANLA